MKRSISLRRYLSVQFALMAVLPVVIIIVLAWMFIVPQMRASINVRNKALALTIAGQVLAHLKGGENQLTALADYVMAEGPFPPGQLTALLDANCGQGYLFETIYTASHDQKRISNVGLAHARRSDRPDLMGMDLSGRGFLFQTQKDDQADWSQTFLSTVTSRMAVGLMLPLGNEVIVGEITLTKLSELISHLPGEAGLFAIVMNRQGRIVADSTGMREGQLFDLATSLPANEGADTHPFITFQTGGQTMLGAMVTVEQLDWSVLVAQPYLVALRPLRDAFTLTAVGLVLAMGMALALALNRAGRLSRFFRFYTHQAQAISRGEYEVRLLPSKTIEFKVLGENLKAMAQTIKRREAQLVASEKRIKGVVANVPGAVYQLRATREHVYTNKFISENTTEIFGLAPDPQTIFDDFFDHIPDDEKDHYVQTIRDAVDEAKPWVYEGRFVKPSGETIWFSSNAIPYVAEDAIDFYGVLLDITDRKKMESSLRLTQFCFDKASVGIYRMGYDGQILDTNAQACHNLGYTRQELLRLTVFDIDPDYSPQQYTELIEKLRNIRAHMIETRHKRKNGEIFPVQIRLNLTEYEDQEFIVAFEEDITDRKKWQRDLEESERRYRSLFDGAPMMYVVTDAKGIEPVIQNANNMFLETLGYQRDDVVGTPMARYYTEDSKKEMFDTGYKAALSGGSQSVERELVTRDKKIVHSLLRTLPDYGSDGQVISIRAMFLDITERKKALEQVKQLRNYLSNINDSMPSVLVGVDARLRVTQWNKQAESATGIAHEKALAKPLTEVYPELVKKVRRINDAISNRQVIRMSKIASLVNGARRFEDVTIFPVVGNGMEGAVIRVDDVTERVRLEEMMIQNEKMLSVGGLAAGMAHEINNPLAGILQNAVVLKNRLTGDLQANHKAAEAAGTTMAAIQTYMQQRNLLTMIENICDSGHRAATIVQNMLSFARKSDRAVSSHDLTVLLEQTLALAQTDYDMKKHYDFKQIEIVREYDPSLPVVPCESSKLQQVLFNILKNGAEAMAEARDNERPSRFILRVKNENQWVRVEIEDNGPGMPEAVRRRIFEPFFTTKPVGKGTGLGLSVSYFIITENHGGEMDAHVVDGGGTRFVIRLPKDGRGA